MIITIATSKGGAGKTTVARLLLGNAALSGRSVAGLDADLNQTLAHWCQQLSRYPITVRSELDETKIVAAISELEELHDLVVVDTAGAATQATVFAIGCADLVLVPLKLSSADVTEACKTMALVESAAKMMRRPVTARAVMMGYKPRTSIATHVENEIANAKLPLMATKVHDLVAFEEMTFSGAVPTSGPAGTQAKALLDEALELIDAPLASVKKRA